MPYWRWGFRDGSTGTINAGRRRRSSDVERDLPKVDVGVRITPPAPGPAPSDDGVTMTSLAEVNQRFTDQLREVDDLALIVLKGHLVMEGLMNDAIEAFLLHAEFADVARMRVSQKIALCRAISTSDQNNRMWEVISAINVVRNALSHSLDPERRARAIESLRKLYEEEFKHTPDAVNGIPKSVDGMPADMAVCLFAIGGCLGYLQAHLAEVRRLKERILEMDAAMNGSAMSRRPQD